MRGFQKKFDLITETLQSLHKEFNDGISKQCALKKAVENLQLSKEQCINYQKQVELLHQENDMAKNRIKKLEAELCQGFQFKS